MKEKLGKDCVVIDRSDFESVDSFQSAVDTAEKLSVTGEVTEAMNDDIDLVMVQSKLEHLNMEEARRKERADIALATALSKDEQALAASKSTLREEDDIALATALSNSQKETSSVLCIGCHKCVCVCEEPPPALVFDFKLQYIHSLVLKFVFDILCTFYIFNIVFV